MKYSKARTATNMKYFNQKLNTRVSLCSKVTTKIAQMRFKDKEITRITISVDWMLRLVTPSPVLGKQEL